MHIEKLKFSIFLSETIISHPLFLVVNDNTFMILEAKEKARVKKESLQIVYPTLNIIIIIYHNITIIILLVLMSKEYLEFYFFSQIVPDLN